MKWRETVWSLALALALCVTGVHAQDQQQNSEATPSVFPIPPLSSGGVDEYDKPPVAAARGVYSAYDLPPNDPAPIVADSNTLSGVQVFGLGSAGQVRNIFDPSVSLSEIGETLSGGGQSNVGSATIFNGILNLNHTWDNDRLTMLYNGGGTYNVGTSTPNSQYQDLSVSEQTSWKRWRVLIGSDFMASPGAAFTGTGMGGPGLIAQSATLLGSSLNGIGQTFIPSESIETGNAMRYRYAATGQAEYSLSRRSTFTFSGSYGLLHFTNDGYVNSDMLNAQAGYDYLLNSKNSVAILAGYGKIDYLGTTGTTTDYMAALAYGRRITGRLAFQVGVGPQQVRSDTGTGNFAVWLPSINTSLTYERRRTGLTLAYVRGVSAGSGVFLGAKSNTVSGSAHYLFTRFWTGTVTGGYAQNDSLAPAGVAALGFSDWFTGTSLGRPIGSHAHINFNYGLQKQSSTGVCPVTSCGSPGYQQTFGMTVGWHLRPAG